MALQIIPIIRALTPLISASSSVVASIAQRRREGDDLEAEERVQALENDLAATNRVLASLAEQVQRLAEELEKRNVRLEQRRRRERILSVVCVVALALSTLAIWTAFQ